MTPTDKPLILLAGGAGYIGLHVAVELIAADHDVLILDDFSNAPRDGPGTAARSAGRAPTVVAGDVRDRPLLGRLFSRHEVAAVVLLAGLRCAPESVGDPIRYYDVNLGVALALIEAMERAQVRRLVFSSSRAVYGETAAPPFAEDAPLARVNPHGRTKLLTERTLEDAAAGARLNAVSLRYFDPIGADPAGGLAEQPRGAPTNLFPLILASLHDDAPRAVCGADWSTRDGSCVGDYIHVVDLAQCHLHALERLLAADGASSGRLALNLGRGEGDTVFEAIEADSQAAGRAVPHRGVGRRPGDVATSVPYPRRAAALLGWRADQTLDDVCGDLALRSRGRAARGQLGVAGAAA